MFTSKVMAIIMLKMAYLMYFLLNTEKKTDPVWARYLNASEILFGPFTKYYGLWSSDLPLANCQHF